MKFCEPAVLEDMQLTIDKIGRQENTLCPAPFSGFHDKGPTTDIANLMIKDFHNPIAFILHFPFPKFHLIRTSQFIKGKGFLVCDVRVAAHTQKLPKKWSAESEANGLSCEAARENSQPTSTK